MAIKKINYDSGEGGEYLAEVGDELPKVVDRADERAQLGDVRRYLHAFDALLAVGGEVVVVV